MASMDEILDRPVTLRSIFSGRLATDKKVEMSFYEYLAIPGGLHTSREGKDQSRYRFACTENITGHGYALAMVARLLRVEFRDDGGLASYEHELLTVNGEPLLLRETRYLKYIVAAGLHEGFVVEYKG